MKKLLIGLCVSTLTACSHSSISYKSDTLIITSIDDMGDLASKKPVGRYRYEFDNDLHLIMICIFIQIQPIK